MFVFKLKFRKFWENLIVFGNIYKILVSQGVFYFFGNATSLRMKVVNFSQLKRLENTTIF